MRRSTDGNPVPSFSEETTTDEVQEEQEKQPDHSDKKQKSRSAISGVSRTRWSTGGGRKIGSRGGHGHR